MPFTTKDGRIGVVRESKARDARACLAIVAQAVAERPRTLSVLEDELWQPSEWRRHRVPWGDRGVWLAAELDGVVVGQLSCERALYGAARHTAGFGITVARTARDVGVGRALLRALEVWARAYGVTRLTLGVFTGNDRAHALYASMGYLDEGIDRAGARFPEGTRDVLRMAKLLGPDPEAERLP